MINNDHQNNFHISSQWSMEIMNSSKPFIDKYNNGKDKMVEASLLFQLKVGTADLIEANATIIKETLKPIKRFVKSVIQKSDQSKQFAKMILQNLSDYHRSYPFCMDGILTPRTFIGVEKFYEMYEEEYFPKMELEKVVKLKKESNRLRIDELALESILKEIVLNAYPQRIKHRTIQEIQDEINSAGRPDDPTAPQKPIENYIKGLLEKAQKKEEDYVKYWHFDGAHKDSPNKSQIIEELMNTKLIGQLSKETVKDRVNRALSSLGY